MLKLSILLLFCVSTTLTSPWFDREPIVKDASTTSFDYFVFRQIWPQATCMFPGPHSCSINASVSTWVVHGLWPSIAGRTDGPFFCNKTLPFNPRKLDWLLSRLEEYWPNLYTDTPLESFWYIITVQIWVYYHDLKINPLWTIGNMSGLSMVPVL